MTTLVSCEVKENIALITLNRPEAANAMSAALLVELNAVIDTINADEHVVCVIITADGEKAFCAGADLKERRGMSDEQVVQAVQSIGKTIARIEAIAVPVIAAINGVAFGGGLELALACDIRIAANHARFGLTETALAIIPGAGGTQRLPRLIGLGQAKRLIFTAKPIDAEEALKIALVEEVVDQEDLLARAFLMAREITANGPVALRLAKAAINNGMQVDLQAGLALEHTYYKETITTRDRTEGLIAFAEKRKPSYQGR